MPSKKRKYVPTEDQGVAAVKQVAAREIQWPFREQPTADFGIDAHLEIADEESRPTGRLIGLQIKSGASYFANPTADGKYRFYVDKDHYEYWVGHSLPVAVVLHDPAQDLTIWEWASPETIKQTKKGYYLDVPGDRLFDSKARDRLALQVPPGGAAALKRRFAFDAGMMRRLRGRSVFAEIDVWVNKSWGIRGVAFKFDEPDKQEVDIGIPLFAPTQDVGRVMYELFPWLDYKYVSVEEFSGEVEQNILSVKLSPMAEKFLDTEDYFADPPPRPNIEKPSLDDDDADCDYDYRYDNGSSPDDDRDF